MDGVGLILGVIEAEEPGLELTDGVAEMEGVIEGKGCGRCHRRGRGAGKD